MAGTLIVSLDFELLWGVLDFDDPKAYMPNVLGGREAVPRLLKLFEEYNIHATWATVGFMFAENYDELKKYFPADTLRPAYENTKLYPYDKFKEIGENEEAEPCFYGSSLIKLISEAPGQEIGSHTFSHYYCREKGQNPEQFKADMTAALRLASDKGFTLKSVVLPRNQCTDECVTVLTDRKSVV